MRFIAGLADDAANPKMVNMIRIARGRSYVGHLTQWEGLGWTHSLHGFGKPAFISPDLCIADFWEVKASLRASTHKAIFGYEASKV